MFYQAKNVTQIALFFTLFTGTGHMMSMDNTNESTTQTSLENRKENIKNFLRNEIGEGVEQKKLPELRTKVSQLDRSTPEYKAQDDANAAWNISVLPLWDCLQANDQKEEPCQEYKNLYDQAWTKVESCEKTLDNTPEKQALLAISDYSKYLCDFEYYQSALNRELNREQQNLLATQESLDRNSQNLEQLEKELSKISQEYARCEYLSTISQQEIDQHKSFNNAVALARSIKIDTCVLSNMNKDHKERLERLFETGIFPQPIFESGGFAKSSKDWIKEMFESCEEKVRLGKD